MEMLVDGHGRISMVTYKGSKKNTAKTALLSPFRPLVVQFQKDAGLRKLINIEASSNDSMLKSGTCFFCGFYINELIWRLCPADAYLPELYHIYRASMLQLQQLSEAQTQGLELELLLRQFEYRLLEELGYGLELTTDSEMAAEVIDTSQYELSASAGFIAVKSRDRSFSGADLKLMAQLLYQKVTLTDLPSEQAKSVMHKLKMILRQGLHRHLGDKPLKSRELFRKK